MTFFCLFNDPKLALWSAHLFASMLTITFKCSLKAFLLSLTLSSRPTVMALTHARYWAGVMLLGRPSLEGSTWGTHSIRVLEHVDWEISNNFDTSCVLRPCCNRAIAFDLFSFEHALMGKETFTNIREKCPKRPHYQPKVRKTPKCRC